MTIFPHWFLFDNKLVVWFRCSEETLLRIRLQHDSSGKSNNTLGVVVIYVLIYSMCRSVCYGIWCTRILQSPLVREYCDKL